MSETPMFLISQEFRGFNAVDYEFAIISQDQLAADTERSFPYFSERAGVTLEYAE